jgi:acyl-CoA dehydrogenase
MYDLNFSEEQQQLRKIARDFARSKIAPVAGQLDEEGHFPAELLTEGWRLGLMNCEIPEEFGGLGLSCLSHCMIQEEIAWACAGVNTSVAANALASLPLIIAGSREQKEKYLGWLLVSPFSPRTAAPSPTLAPMSQDCAPTLSKTATATS